jgi:hypothetical protein
MNIGRTWNRFTMTIMNAITKSRSLMKRGAPHGGGETDDGTARADRYIGGRVNFFIVEAQVSQQTTSSSVVPPK